MRIVIGFTCRECESDQELVLDTSKFGVLLDSSNPELVLVTGEKVSVPVATGQVVSGSESLELRCAGCGHVSGELGMGYGFNREIHAPSWER